ncbi:hypothetical protein WJX75_003826 [Coccomyxa subellipsoidea]|uniref:Uncharacterized protein n=1 Tax=Coccomyxa subellipsoidea TaxID=248742 RepID=A0ABR2YJ48_9CHLO
MQSKGKALGTLTIGSSSPNAFAGRWAEAADIVAAMVAPYLHIHDLRQHLEVKQTCLLDCLPAKVASHMLEKRAMGMTPVMQSGNNDGSSSSDSHEM